MQELTNIFEVLETGSLSKVRGGESDLFSLGRFSLCRLLIPDSHDCHECHRSRTSLYEVTPRKSVGCHELSVGFLERS
jgi:hypothetical protein